MASLGSSTRSAARATFSAYKSLPIRWRLAGGSAVLTLIILCGFALLVGALTTRRLNDDFSSQVRDAADELQRRMHLKLVEDDEGRPDIVCVGRACPNLSDFADPGDAAIRVVFKGGEAIDQSKDAPFLGVPALSRSSEYGPWQVETRALPIEDFVCCAFLQYARKLSDVEETADRIRFFLVLGVLGGGLLALAAGLTTARRAMSPIAQLTEAARTVERTRDPSIRLPAIEAEDEVAELARTLESMLRSLDAARAETESALGRQREFVADASHELRTPLTSVLANLELLECELEGEQRETAASALRSTRRMRRLVADLLLLARADAGRVTPQRPLDLAEVVTDAAAELEPVAGSHHILVDADPGSMVEGSRDELHRLVLNLVGNALAHTPPGTEVHARVRRQPDGGVLLVVEDDGPGIPDELRARVFERFVRGGADRSGSSGLGLAIVQAVARSHGGEVVLTTPPSGRGARFEVRLPSAASSPNLSPLNILGA